MLTHRGFSAWIMCNGEPVPEYLVAVDDKTNEVQCWIPSEAGHSFSVWWRDHDTGDDTCSYIELDGFAVPGRFLFGKGMANRSGVRTGECVERCFMFKNVEEEDTEGVVAESGGQNVGMIVLRIKRILRLGSRAANPLLPIPPSRGNQVGGLCIGYTDHSRAWHQFPSTWVVGLRDRPSTWVRFVFRYRSHEWLRAQGIMHEPPPRPPPQRRSRRNGITINTRAQNLDKAAADITKPETPLYTTVSPHMLVLNRSPTLIPKEEPRISPSRIREIIPYDVMQGNGTGFPGYDPRYWQTNSSDESTSDDVERL